MARPLLPDGLWAAIEPLLPLDLPKPKGGRPRVSDRAALTGILFVLRSGTPWELLPREMGCGSGMRCWRRLRDWQEAGVWDSLQKVLLDRLGGRNAVDFSRAVLDSASIAVKKGGAHTGPNPTDRAKPGTKRHIITDAQGIPLAVRLTGANVHDSRMIEEMVDAVPAICQCWGPPRRRPAKLHADKAYDHLRCRQALAVRHIQHRIARRGIESSQRLGRHRWGSSKASPGWRSSGASPSATSAGPTSTSHSPPSQPPSSHGASSQSGFVIGS